MATEDGQDYYIGVLPKPPIASEELVDILAQKLQSFRLEVLSEADGTAFGRSTYAAEKKRTGKSYRENIVSPTDFWYACFIAPGGLKGGIFKNVSQSPSTEHVPGTPVSEDDDRIMREGRWIGLASGHGPIAKEDWNIKILSGQTFSDEVESRYHLTGLYFLHRGVKLPDGESLFMELCLGSHDYMQRLALARATRKPAYCRLRGTITPAALGTKLMKMYEDKLRYHIIGWVPQVTAMIVNYANVESWPTVEENPKFFSDCIMPTFEKLVRIYDDRWEVLAHDTPQGEIWARL